MPEASRQLGRERRGLCQGILASAVGGFAAVAVELVVRGTVWFDAVVFSWLARIETPTLTTAMRGVTLLGDGTTLLILSALGVVLCWSKGHRRAALLIVAAGVGAAVLTTGLKLAFTRERPESSLRLVLASSYAFPSGHSMASAACYGAFAVTLGQRLPGLRLLALVSSAALVLLVGFSRVYLRVHFPSDVLAGWLLGVAWLTWLRSVLVDASRYSPDAAPPAPPAPELSAGESSSSTCSSGAGTRNEQASSSSGAPMSSHTDVALLLSSSSDPHSSSGVSRSAHLPACSIASTQSRTSGAPGSRWIASPCRHWSR